jgi:hypothetical protein
MEYNQQKASCHTLKASSRRERRLKRFKQLASPMEAPQRRWNDAQERAFSFPSF